MTAPADTRPPIDEEWLVRMRETKPEFLAKLFAVFQEDEPKRLAKLEAAVDAGDNELTRFLAHSIKGAAAVLGMDRLRDASRELEFAARDGRSEALAAGLALVRSEMSGVFAMMRGIAADGEK